MVGNQLRVGIIIPAYNAERYLRDTLDSLLHQTHPIDKITVIDDGSTDQTSSIAEEYAAIHSHVILLKLDANYGESKAVNLGWGLTDTDLIGVVSADDPQPHEWISQMYEVIHSKNGYVFYYPNLITINDLGVVISRRILPNFTKECLLPRLICLPSAGTIIAKYRLPLEFIPRDESCIFPSDLIQFMSLSLFGDALHIKSAWGQWREHPQGLSQTISFVQKYSSFLSALDKWIMTHRSSLSYSQTQEIYANFFAQAIFAFRPKDVKNVESIKPLMISLMKKSLNLVFVFKILIIPFQNFESILRRFLPLRVKE
jgi:glycosyltransferase involved in cell wall biosynthesis